MALETELENLRVVPDHEAGLVQKGAMSEGTGVASG